jgi:hypothetical protein
MCEYRKFIALDNQCYCLPIFLDTQVKKEEKPGMYILCLIHACVLYL